MVAIILLTVGVFAYEDAEGVSSLYIQSIECPSDIMNYATSNATRFIRSIDEESILSYD